MFLLPFLLFAWPAQANPTTELTSCASYCLSVTPIVCVTTEASERCEQDMHIQWQAPLRTQSACVYVENTLLQCWDVPKTTANKTTGSWQGPVVWPEEGTVSLTDQSGAIVAEVRISTQSLRPRRTSKTRSTPFE
ncbi:hypothetical protein CWE15_00690 [Aliidiomarina taiwanensis]|uniref:DUF3019 domain-containing protein n=1 Tax=Aliidiomarina taiwanensis TaxID=946228 RepID=A0A432X8V8_9GAMM|nr:DUF3019 domain-containing protein [Aliidiomarina taiwanensis]RUO43754.1 hypothetical protein CWE15_00690 [Aliidiomarina taiwanensis]